MTTAAAIKAITYDFPLRPGCFVTLTLPVDLTMADAKRFCDFIMSLPFPDGDAA